MPRQRIGGRAPLGAATMRTASSPSLELGEFVLRAVTPEDGPGVVGLVVAAGLFARDEAAFLADGALLPHDGTTCLVEDADDGRGLASIVLDRPGEAAERTFDLTMIAVRPDLQGGGRCPALTRHAWRVAPSSLALSVVSAHCRS